MTSGTPNLKPTNRLLSPPASPGSAGRQLKAETASTFIAPCVARPALIAGGFFAVFGIVAVVGVSSGWFGSRPVGRRTATVGGGTGGTKSCRTCFATPAGGQFEHPQGHGRSREPGPPKANR